MSFTYWDALAVKVLTSSSNLVSCASIFDWTVPITVSACSETLLTPSSVNATLAFATKLLLNFANFSLTSVPRLATAEATSVFNSV